MDNCKNTHLVNCDEGQRMGCATFCCRKLVRLQPDEMEPANGNTPPKGFVDKDSEGYCIHFDRDNGRCSNWKNRPKVCREYDCNSDFLLQIVLRKGFKNIADLAKKSVNTHIPKENYIKIPVIHSHAENIDTNQKNMNKIYFQGKSYRCRENETILQVFMRHGVTVPFSCGNGVCHTCLQRCENGLIPPKAQKGLRETLKEKDYFLICKCIPENNMEISLPQDTDLFNQAVVYKKELLAPDVCRLLLEPATQLYYHPGQFINIRNQQGEMRSYSLSSVPQEDYFLEIHVKRVPNGVVSNWIFDELSENDEFEFQGALGSNYYVPGEQHQPLLLIGTGTGLSPLLGIVRDALSNGHTGPIHLYHGSRHPYGLYLQPILEQLSKQHDNFYPVSCVSGHAAPGNYRAGRANDIALAEHTDLEGWRMYLCGHPKMVEDMQQAAQTAGANPQEIHADPFWDWASVNDASLHDTDANTAERIRCAELRNYPDPDLELWKGLDEGRLLSKVLIDFYDHVYDDPLLSPFFEGATKQRLIEKQYNFMCQVLTGEDVYFGERPRNAHHWMVISDELLDHRETLMESSLRRFGVPEHLVRRLRAIEEIYRKDIVKYKPWKKVAFGKELPVEGFDEMVMDDATLCDSCQQEILVGERVQYHVRLGKVYCKKCRQDTVD